MSAKKHQSAFIRTYGHTKTGENYIVSVKLQNFFALDTDGNNVLSLHSWIDVFIIWTSFQWSWKFFLVFPKSKEMSYLFL